MFFKTDELKLVRKYPDVSVIRPFLARNQKVPVRLYRDVFFCEYRDAMRERKVSILVAVKVLHGNRIIGDMLRQGAFQIRENIRVSAPADSFAGLWIVPATHG